MLFTLKAKEIYLENEVLKNSSVVVRDGIIEAIGDERGDIVDLGDVKLLAGFLDIHVHGGNGFDTMDASYEAINEISKYKIAEGVTSFCPTTVTTSIEKTKKAVDNVNYALQKGVEGAEIIGTFLEGPYIDPAYKGSHPEEYVRNIDLNEIQDLINMDNVASIAIAPNKENAIDAIKMIVKNKTSKNRSDEENIGDYTQVRIGHSGAKCETIHEAIDCGSNCAIHVFNAMSAFSHRDPGMVGAVLSNDEIYAEVICDMIHVHADAIKVLVKSKGYDKIILVTDCMMAGGLADGNYKLGELAVKVTDAIARTESGVLAGSTLSIIKAIKNMTEIVGVPLQHVVNMATINPAKCLNISQNVGSIAVGKKANFTAINDNFDIEFVMVGGHKKM